jgi:hypothetical protein
MGVVVALVEIDNKFHSWQVISTTTMTPRTRSRMRNTSNVNFYQQTTNLMQQRSSAIVNAVASVAIVVAHKLASQDEECQPRRLTNEGGPYHSTSTPKRRQGPRPRKRRSVADVYQELGDVYFRRAYRMRYNTFKRLASMLCPYITLASGKTEDGSSRNYRYIPNGAIATDVRLASHRPSFS